MTNTLSVNELEIKITETGKQLLDGLSRAIGEIPESTEGPQRLAVRLGVDKVLTSRLLKAIRAEDPMAALHRMPGPDPLRRVSSSLKKIGITSEALLGMEEAIESYDRLIRQDIGDLSALQALLSSWVPEAKREFELRRLQAAYRAISQLKGFSASVYADTALFWPSEDGEHIDVAWIKTIVDMRRLRPGATLKLTSHRAVEPGNSSRQARSLKGNPIEDLSEALLSEYCSPDVPRLSVNQVGEKVHYILDEPAFGSRGAATLVTCEINRGELPRYIDPQKGRLAWASAEPSVPSKKLQFDAFVHKDLWGGEAPGVRVYDTTIGGIADVNDPSRDIDRLDLAVSVESLPKGVGRARSTIVPQYHSMIDHVQRQLGLNGEDFLGYRVQIDYPLYGSQTALTFRTTAKPSG